MVTVPFGPVPSTDEKSHVRQNTAIQQLFGNVQDQSTSIDSLTVSLAALAALVAVLSWEDISGLSSSDPPAQVNIKDYGAIGDGTTDNQSSIQAAIDYLYDNFGQGVCLVPNGNFKVSSTVVVKGGVVLVGSGRTGSVISSLAADVQVVQFDATCLYAGSRHLTIFGYNNSGATRICRSCVVRRRQSHVL